MAILQDPFQQLPDEMLLEIFKNLDVKDLCKVDSVSQRFSRVSEDEPLWRKKFSEDWPGAPVCDSLSAKELYKRQWYLGRVWACSSPACKRVEGMEAGYITAFRGDYAYSIHRGEMRIGDLKKRAFKRCRDPWLQEHVVTCMAPCESGCFLGASDGEVAFVSSGKPRLTALEMSLPRRTVVGLVPEGDWLIVALSCGRVEVWDLDKGRYHTRLAAGVPSGDLYAQVALLGGSDGRLITHHYWEQAIRVWDLVDGSESASIQWGGRGRLSAVHVEKDELFGILPNGDMLIWHWPTQRLLQEIQAPKEEVWPHTTAQQIWGDYMHVVVASGQKLHIYSRADGRLVNTLQAGGANYSHSLALKGFAERILCAYKGGPICAWEHDLECCSFPYCNC